MYKVLFSGDRNWSDRQLVIDELDRLAHIYKPHKIIVIAGKAKGLDTIVEEEAEKRGIHVAGVRALWDVYLKAAGPMRNAVMGSLDPDEVICYHDDIENSKGTKDMKEW